MAEDEPKPSVGGYALVDWRLSRIEKTLSDNVSQTVPVGIYNVNQENIAKEFARLHSDLALETAARIATETRIQANADDIEKQKRQWRLTISAGVLVAVILVFITPITHALGLS